ncbi:MAG TPA: orotidine-5'-phosphate decarboxylase [Anaerolineales bacterium]|nr:orotidine-5'-phosphate decarboxylase [Anaerolineales bacterium]
MAQPFFEFLEQRCREADSLLCVGLDPHIRDLTRPDAGGVREFCLRLIESTAPYAAAFKPNSAFFEVFGAEGIQALKDVIASVPTGIPVVLDAKRGDIGSTSNAYAQAAFGSLGAHAITVNAYLGQDSVAPFLTDPAKGVFLLCKTSNPGAADVQDLLVDRQPLYLRVARLALRWNANKNIGLVVGATYPEVLADLRREVPNLWFLAPGIGAQGAEVNGLAAALRTDGLGLLVPISRAISQAVDRALAAREFRDAINSVRKTRPQETRPPYRHHSLADDLLRLGCVQFGEFKLKSGLVSPIYLDLRRLSGDPAALSRAAAAYAELLFPLTFDRLAALPYAALPIAAAISIQSGWPLIYPRKETKEYGTKSPVEGLYQKGETVVVIDDLVTTGESKFEGIQKLESVGLQVRDVVVLINRQSRKSSAFADRGLALHAVLHLPELLGYWHARGAITIEQRQAALDFLQQA